MPVPPSLENYLSSEIDPAFALRARFIFNEIDNIKPQRVLDAGCGRGFYPHALAEFSFIKEIHGVELEEKFLRIAQGHCKDKRINLQLGSIYQLPYKNDYFDVAICSEVLEHLTDDVSALLELKRVVKTDGKIIITVPNKNYPIFWDPLNYFLTKFFNTHINKDVQWLAGIWANHERLYTENDLINLAKKCGLVIFKQSRFLAHAWPFSHFILYGIGKNIVESFSPAKGFYRFNFSSRPLAYLLARVFAFPSVFDKYETNSRFQGLGILLTKHKK